MGHTLPSSAVPSEQQASLAAFEKGVKSLGLLESYSFGAAKGDIKLTKKGPMLGEIAARLSGGYMSGWTYPYSSGVEVTKGAIYAALGEEPPANLLKPSRNWTSAERAFISIPGLVAQISGFDTIKRDFPLVKDSFLRAKPGDAVNFPQNNVGKCGNVISCAATRDEAVRAAEEAARSVLFRLKPHNKATDAFLAASTAFPPDAYKVLTDPDAKDYGGRTVREALLAVEKLRGRPVSPSERRSGPFLQALKRGGYQGALYYLDSGYASI
jgi:biotin carboxylase